MLGYGLNSLLQSLKKGFDITGQTVTSDKRFLDLLAQMIAMSPGERITPEEVIQHPFLTMNILSVNK